MVLTGGQQGLPVSFYQVKATGGRITLMNHLNKDMAELAKAGDADRMHYLMLDDLWIAYPKANQVIENLEDLLKYPKHHLRSNLFLAGAHGNGKTGIIRQIELSHERYFEEETFHLPILVVRAPGAPSEAQFYGAALLALGEIYGFRESCDSRRGRFMAKLKWCNVRMLVIDDIDDMVVGKTQKHKLMLVIIKSLTNVLDIPVVAVGTAAAQKAFCTNDQIISRFDFEELPAWSADQVFFEFLAAFERALPLREPSNLTEPALATRILEMSQGTVGGVSSLLQAAAIIAIEEKIERINPDILNQVIKKTDWAWGTPPTSIEKLRKWREEYKQARREPA